MTQDDTFIPATINGPSPVLPADTLNGQVDIVEMDLKYSGRISQDLSMQASYNYQDRDNKTAQLDFPQIVTDSINQGTAQNSLYDKRTKNSNLKANTVLPQRLMPKRVTAIMKTIMPNSTANPSMNLACLLN